MAVQRLQNRVQKPRRSKKGKSRTIVDVSSSESDSNSESEQGNEVPRTVSQKIAEPSDKGQSLKTAKTSKSAQAQDDEDIPMTDANASPDQSVSVLKPGSNPTTSSTGTEDFASIYLRKVTVELADDLDKVREAKDFKSSSLPMLIHALRQGESMFSVEEKRRVVGAAIT